MQPKDVGYNVMTITLYAK